MQSQHGTAQAWRMRRHRVQGLGDLLSGPLLSLSLCYFKVNVTAVSEVERTALVADFPGLSCEICFLRTRFG